ncbi:hypothetical protein BU24DRAFT_423601 [Aaosphaeria arxii CBS 175.79]|uniref:Sodium/calcium exchanger membrane region domain-containing protein n=1 Tax=Aaosphaeria arxii CBS 175.79 TaxID=1450172 RepID=A0A6A5XPL6_9PLEO|nr:uncharacterized protein BU24DRAFT_423601 [Aaosphaeria arxii CBS 175.79]KAF2014701.1 hypothetical protein BU24DRAFT_423601 [Aaosphaeria arxii CBS 175.79]
MAGVTFLAFGNGSPDVFSTFAAFSTNSASLAIGELIGAAGFITAVVAGSMALVRPFKVARKSFIRDVSFFIFAACFSMVFLWDGKLSLWESILMVAFYIFYVCFVMVWHWWLGRRLARRRRAAAIRSQYVLPGGDEEEIPEEYHDEDDGPATSGTRSPLGGASADDFSALERVGMDDSLEGDDNEEFRERWLGELSNNMRLGRSAVGSRRNTHTPIRPSLVGALEFRAVLTSLNKSRNIQSMPINLRRYSDDPTFTSAQQQGLISSSLDPAPRPPYDVPTEESGLSPHIIRPSVEVQGPSGNRVRAVSTNDIGNRRIDPSTWQVEVPSIEFGPPSPEDDRTRLNAPSQPMLAPNFTLSPPTSLPSSRSPSPGPARGRTVSPNKLAPPSLDGTGTASTSASSSPVLGPSNDAQRRPLPKLQVPGASSPPIPFPAYTDYPFSAGGSSRTPSIRLPSPSASPESLFPPDHFSRTANHTKPPKWWPTRFLPSPRVLTCTLFPTLDNWKTKSIWEKMLGVVAAPSVFLLTITLPVVETHRDDQSDIPPSPSLSLAGTLHEGVSPNQPNIVVEPDSPSGAALINNKPDSTVQVSRAGSANPIQQSPLRVGTQDSRILPSPGEFPVDPLQLEPKQQWNRWLVITQVFTAPFFVVFVVWANTDLENPRALVKPTLYSLLLSLVLLAAVLTTTTPARPPAWRTLLCFFGFAVSIAWISSIANEVVGVLKTLGVILDISDAILGLTIFAVGNSLGDLVADITVARLGFPVMALSACFGGPMLNILLGIGLSGCYITIKGERHRHEKHPDRPIRFKPYHIDVSTTLVISGATLLVTLVGLMVVVPWRGWRMDRKIGWGLIALWTFSTIANVIVEVTGNSSNVS